LNNKTAVYLFDEIDRLDDGFPERSIPLLSEERRKKAFSCHFPRDRKCSVAVYLLLRLALSEKHGINEPVEFKYEIKGKPVLMDYPHIRFNLSHCFNAAACVISDLEVGVDIQKTALVSNAVLKRVLTEKEFEKYKSSQTPDEFFTSVWTKKESWLKRTGQGIGVNLTTLETEHLDGLLPFFWKEYHGCVSGVCGPVQFKHVTRSCLENIKGA
jgi:4'-phosphopantetheinyl transferase